MNNNGQLGLAIIAAVVFFIIGFMVVNFVMDEVTIARGSSALDCSTSTISDGTKLTYLAVDWVIPGLILSVIGGAGAIITAKLLL